MIYGNNIAIIACAIIASIHTFIHFFVISFLIKKYYLKAEIINNMHLSGLSHFLRILNTKSTISQFSTLRIFHSNMSTFEGGFACRQLVLSHLIQCTTFITITADVDFNDVHDQYHFITNEKVLRRMVDSLFAQLILVQPVFVQPVLIQSISSKPNLT